MKFLTPSLDPYFTTESKSKSDPMHLSVLLDREEGMVVSFQDPIGLYKKKTFIFHIDQKLRIFSNNQFLGQSQFFDQSQ